MILILALTGHILTPFPIEFTGAGLCPASEGCIVQTGGAPNVANWARDGNIAIREEFDAAIASGDADRLKLFIARHSDHPLAEQARAELAKMQ